MGSTRLPGKTLAPLAGIPLLGRVIERASAPPCVQQVIVATTQEADDDALVEYARRLNVGVYRGSTDDVLARFYHAAVGVGASAVMRVTADDPFKDPDVCGRAISIFQQ